MEAIDLFSGAGGLSLGLKGAGWGVAAAVEYDETAIATHKRNFPEVTHIHNDVQELDFRRFRGIDLVAGGPPCQPFSVSGKRLGQFDVRDMVPQFVRAVAEASPRAFLMENVAGLTNRRFQSYLEEKISELHQLGYNVSAKVLNSADYGVAQKRRRLIVVGIRNDQGGCFAFPERTHGEGTDKKHVTTLECLNGVPEDIANNAKVVFCKNPVLRSSPYAGMLFQWQREASRPLMDSAHDSCERWEETHPYH